MNGPARRFHIHRKPDDLKTSAFIFAGVQLPVIASIKNDF
jgi:hypothetical protein